MAYKSCTEYTPEEIAKRAEENDPILFDSLEVRKILENYEVEDPEEIDTALAFSRVGTDKHDAFRLMDWLGQY